MKKKLWLLSAFLFGCCYVAAQEQIPRKAANKAAAKRAAPRQEVDDNGVLVPPKHTCITGASYTGVIWEKKYPYPTGQGFFADEPAVIYRKYEPNLAEEEKAEKDCKTNHQRYLAQLERAEQTMDEEAYKNLKVTPVSKADVLKVVDCMLNPRCAKWLDRKVDDNGGVHVVFLYVNRRYTLYTPHGNNKERWLGVWVRREGTTTQKDLETIGDLDLNGTVDNGSTGDHRQKFLAPTKGQEWRGYWQIRYNMAVGFTREYIVSNPTKW